MSDPQPSSLPSATINTVDDNAMNVETSTQNHSLPATSSTNGASSAAPSSSAPPASGSTPSTPLPPPSSSSSSSSSSLSSSSSSSSSSIAANQTLYVHHLNEKIKVDDLRKGLYHVFSGHGMVLAIHLKKTYALRGQAWVVMESIGAAAKSMKELQNFQFYGRPLAIEFAKAKSDIVAKADGTFVQRPKKTSIKKKKGEGEGKGNDKNNKMEEEKTNTSSTKAEKRKRDTDEASVAKKPTIDHSNEPNHIILIENLPAAVTEAMLRMLFQQVKGFVRIVSVAGGNGRAEFSDPSSASVAIKQWQGFKITPNNPLQISYAKK